MKIENEEKAERLASLTAQIVANLAKIESFGVNVDDLREMDLHAANAVRSLERIAGSNVNADTVDAMAKAARAANSLRAEIKNE